MNAIELGSQIISHLPYEPNSQQYQLIAALARYIAPVENDEAMPMRSTDRVFLLNGYAGTGKTTVMGALVKALRDFRIKTVLLAPTGRAAKVLAAACNHPAYTIHRRIYRGDDIDNLWGNATINENKLSDAVFIVDEASMIGNDTAPGSASLLNDLLQYVFSGINCRLIMLGDSAQLPPVGCTQSPAMNRDVLHSLGLHTTRAVITETARQRPTSGILYNATRLRRSMLLDELPVPTIYASPFNDVRVITEPEELADCVSADYFDSTDGIDETIIITRSNRRATEFNAGVRRSILDYEEELVRGERLLVVKNNYHWGAKIKRLDFIANGDIAIVENIIATEERYGLRFADVDLYLPDRDASLQCKIMLDTLSSLSPALDPELAATFEQNILNDPDMFTRSMSTEHRRRALRSNPYYNALQVKYAYCVTCHKAQGGQWRNVYVDTGYIPPESTGLDLYRWLYTATTRATSRLNFISPPFPIK